MNFDDFITQVNIELIRSVNNDYDDNYDVYRYGPLPESEKQNGFLKKSIINKLNKFHYFNEINGSKTANLIKHANFKFSDFVFLYSVLEDQTSRELLIKIIAYRILGHRKVKLPLSTPDFWKNQQLIESHQRADDVVHIDFMNLALPFTNLEFLGVPLKMYYSSLGINIDFIIKQYEYNRDGVLIQAEPGDTVIDGGGCYGDTALYFANKIGKDGKVYAFEFIPDNINLFNKNTALNPAVAPAIELVDRPLWDVSGKDVFYLPNGPASLVSLDEFVGYTGKTKTLAIDDFVKSKGLKSVDFIKMDIEGAETSALRGATETIKTFKPKLAIALYHSTKDFETIPQFINELGLGYKFYLTHSTIYGEETMLFAIAER